MNKELVIVRGMTFNVTITQDEDGVFIAECPSIPGCISQAATQKKLSEYQGGDCIVSGSPR